MMLQELKCSEDKAGVLTFDFQLSFEKSCFSKEISSVLHIFSFLVNVFFSGGPANSQ